jgi:hypothetical protein
LPENNRAIGPQNLVEIETDLDDVVVLLWNGVFIGKRGQDKRLS